MSGEQFSNNAATTLGSDLSSSATTATVSTGSGALFPVLGAGEYFTATLWSAGSTTGTPNEIVRVTARTGDTMTIVRAQEGTTAQGWNVGDTFANYPTAAFYNGIAQAGDIQKQPGNSAYDTGTVNAGAVALSPVVTNLANILFSPIRIMKAGRNTGAYTLNVNGLGPQAVLLNGANLAAGQLPGSRVFEVAWDGSNFALLSVPGVIENVGLAPMAPSTVKANVSGSATHPADVDILTMIQAYFTSGTTGGVNWRKWPDASGKTAIHMSGQLSFVTESVESAALPFTLGSVRDYGVSTIIPSSGSHYDQGAQVRGTPTTTSISIQMQEYGGGDFNWPISARWWVEGLLP